MYNKQRTPARLGVAALVAAVAVAGLGSWVRWPGWSLAVGPDR